MREGILPDFDKEALSNFFNVEHSFYAVVLEVIGRIFIQCKEKKKK